MLKKIVLFSLAMTTYLFGMQNHFFDQAPHPDYLLASEIVKQVGYANTECIKRNQNPLNDLLAQDTTEKLRTFIWSLPHGKQTDLIHAATLCTTITNNRTYLKQLIKGYFNKDIKRTIATKLLCNEKRFVPIQTKIDTYASAFFTTAQGEPAYVSNTACTDSGELHLYNHTTEKWQMRLLSKRECILTKRGFDISSLSQDHLKKIAKILKEHQLYFWHSLRQSLTLTDGSIAFTKKEWDAHHTHRTIVIINPSIPDVHTCIVENVQNRETILYPSCIGNLLVVTAPHGELYRGVTVFSDTGEFLFSEPKPEPHNLIASPIRDALQLEDGTLVVARAHIIHAYVRNGTTSTCVWKKEQCLNAICTRIMSVKNQRFAYNSYKPRAGIITIVDREKNTEKKVVSMYDINNLLNAGNGFFFVLRKSIKNDDDHSDRNSTRAVELYGPDGIYRQTVLNEHGAPTWDNLSDKYYLPGQDPFIHSTIPVVHDLINDKDFVAGGYTTASQKFTFFKEIPCEPHNLKEAFFMFDAHHVEERQLRDRLLEYTGGSYTFKYSLLGSKEADIFKRMPGSIQDDIMQKVTLSSLWCKAHF